MFVSAARAVIRDLAMSGLAAPADILARANTLLVDANPQGMFVSVLVATLNPDTGDLEFASAGHPMPILLARDGSTRDFPAAGGTVLGAIDSLRFQSARTRLNPGDRFLLYTDGVIEAKSPSDHFLGLPALIAAAREHAALDPEDLCRAILTLASDFQHNQLHDDATILVLRRSEVRT